MQMTNTKKVVAILLALLMAFSSTAVLGSAVDFDDDDELIVNTIDNKPAAVSLATKFYTADGTEIADGGTVTPGQSVKARIFMGTNFYSTGTQLILYYDRDFFEANGYTSAIINGRTIKTGSATVNTSNSAANGNGLSVDLKFDCQMDSDEEGTIVAIIKTNDRTPTFCYDDSSYLFEINLKVKETAGEGDGIGSVYAKTADLATEENMGGYINVPYGESTDDKYEVVDAYYLTETPAFTNNSVTVKNMVTFKPNHDNIADTPVSGIIGQTYNVPSVSRSGYTFKGWTNTESDDIIVIAADATTFTMPTKANEEYKAKWNPNVNITLDPNSGKWADDSTAVKTEEVEGSAEWANKPANPTKEGYKFMGWTGEGVVNGALPANYPAATEETTDYTYTAQWKKLVTITIDANGGTWADNTTAAKVYHEDDPDVAVIVGGQPWDTNFVPTYDIPAYAYAASGIARPGYALMGWQVDGGEIVQSFPEIFPEDDATYTAVWTARDVKIYYFVDAQAANAAAVSTAKTGANAARVIVDTVPFGSTYAIRDYSVDGGEVAAWVTPDNASFAPEAEITINTSVVSVDSNGKPGSIVLIASAAQIEEAGEHTATFYTDGGKWSDNESISEKTAVFAEGETITAPEATVSKTGYAFKGWSPELGEMGMADIDFTASWEAIEYAITYDMNGGGEAETVYVAYDSADFEEPAAERDGYDFDGWYLDEECTTALTDWSQIAENATNDAITVYAKWTANKATLTFDPNNGEEKYPPIVRNYDELILGSDVTAPTKTGYYFLYWADENGNEITASSTVTGDATYTAIYAGRTVTINYYVDDEFYEQVVTAYGDTIKVLEYDNHAIKVLTWETADGEYTLTAGADYVVDINARNVNVYAKTTAVSDDEITYSATFKLGADTAKWADNSTDDIINDYHTGETIVVPEAPVRTGYTFAGYDTEPGTMGEASVVFTAQWQPVMKTVTYKYRLITNGVVDDEGDIEALPIEYGKYFEIPELPDKGTYEYNGMLVIGETEYTEEALEAMKVTDDVTVYAIYIQGSFTVSFYAYGDATPTTGDCDVLVDEKLILAGGELETATAPTYEYFTFAGWFDSEDNEWEAGDEVTASMSLYAKYDRVAVKLVPVDSDSTAMIERDGVVETWNTLAEGTTINGVTSIIEPNANAYEAPEDFETYYVYGLEKGLTAEKLANYVKVQGDGSYTVELSETESYGTGAVIKVKDNVTDSIVEEFYIVIFGDINGDAAVTVTDFMNINKELSASEPTWSASQGGVGYLKKAGDLNGDGAITVTDFMKMNAVLSDKNVIDQKVGQAI